LCNLTIYIVSALATFVGDNGALIVDLPLELWLAVFDTNIGSNSDTDNDVALDILGALAICPCCLILFKSGRGCV
jgi:hypothetical protein